MVNASSRDLSWLDKQPHSAIACAGHVWGKISSVPVPFADLLPTDSQPYAP